MSRSARVCPHRQHSSTHWHSPSPNTATRDSTRAPPAFRAQPPSLRADTDAAVFLDCRNLHADIVPLNLRAAGLSLLVIDTRVEHTHTTNGYAARGEACDAGALALGVTSLRDIRVSDLPRAQKMLDDKTFRRVRHVVTENERVLATVRTLREQGPGAIGPLLDASHLSMRNDVEISVPELDLAVETAQAHGAIGARMTGGGFGGAAVALLISDLVPIVTRATETAFAQRGFHTPVIFTAVPSRGAQRER